MSGIVKEENKHKMKIVEDRDTVWIMRWSPYFGNYVKTAWIDHDKKEIRPCHGYYIPHHIGLLNEKYAKRIGYIFNNT